MAHLPAYIRVLQLIADNAAYFADMGSHTTAARSPKLAAFLRDVWKPWYGRVLLIAEHDVPEDQQALLTKNLAEQLIQIRDEAGYRYQLHVYMPAGDQDSELAQIADSAAATIDAIAARDRALHPQRVYARR